MNQWTDDKAWSDRFIPEIKQHLSAVLIKEAPAIEDAERNTDLIVLKLDSVRVACRIRRHEYLQRYSNEFTIRTGRPSGTKTELAKVFEGWGDYMFYGFANAEQTALAAWFIGDLKAFRIWVFRELYKGSGMPGVEKHNADGSSSFFVFDRRAVKDFIVSETP